MIYNQTIIIASGGEDVKQLELSFIGTETIKPGQPFWNKVWHFLKVKRGITT
jgi:hypothetical protein